MNNVVGHSRSTRPILYYANASSQLLSYRINNSVRSYACRTDGSSVI